MIFSTSRQAKPSLFLKVSYIEFLVHNRKEQLLNKKYTENNSDIESIAASLTSAIPDTGKSLDEYRSERLKKYENPY